MTRLLCKLWLTGALSLSATVAGAAPKEAPLSRSETAINAAEADYLKGSYALAKKEAATAANDPHLTEALKPRLYLLLARLAAVYEDQAGVRLWLQRLYQVAPSTELDLYGDPPSIFHEWQTLTSTKADAAKPAAVAAATPAPTPPKALPPVGKTFARGRATWVQYLPFGIGHFDADQNVHGLLFLATDLAAVYGLTTQIVSPHNDSDSDSDSTRQTANVWPYAAPLILGGLYGYELLDLMPQIISRDAEGAEAARQRLSFLPLGAGQAKNGEMAKAAGFGIVEAGFFVAALSQQSNPTIRNLALTGLLVSYAYGSYDAWVNHVPLPGTTAAKADLQVLPTLSPFAYQGVRAPALMLQSTAKI